MQELIDEIGGLDKAVEVRESSGFKKEIIVGGIVANHLSLCARRGFGMCFKHVFWARTFSRVNA